MGMNARNYLYIRKFNRSSAKKIADSKLRTKTLLLKHKIPTPALIASFHKRDEIRSFNWKLPQHGFVIKPARGYGGAGILAIKEWEEDRAVSVTGEIYTKKQLITLLLDILEGSYSLQFLPDSAFIEDLIQPDAFFKKIAPTGIPDIRVIVCNYIPVMAMVRIPTAASRGKANLHQGAIAVGINIRTGVTTYATLKNNLIEYIPGTKIKLRGIEIPHWDELLHIAAKTQSVIGLGYAGVDIVLDEKLGPAILEVNTRPGLSIQIANQTSLRTRLERVEDMDISTPERGVEVAKSLFFEKFSDKAMFLPKVLSVIQPISISNKNKSIKIEAKLDTGAYRSSIDKTIAKDLGLSKTSKKVFVKSASGQFHRQTVQITFTLGGKKITTSASTVDRSHLDYPMIVGRRDLKSFLIKPVLHENKEELDLDEAAEEHHS